ncbi:DMT family transporter [Ferrovibrio sp.]|uniref:DMT family transporter n=1 Tax=Ferrovibrio sp. TaxID=1917215 RepID=UPI0035B36A1D
MAEAARIDADLIDQATLTRGISFMLLGVALFTFNDALGKWLITEVAVGQLLFVRSAAAMLMLLPFILRSGWRSALLVTRPRLHVLRVLLIMGEVAGFYLAVRHLPLADVMSAYQAAPLIVTLLAIPMLGERVGWRRGLAVAVGFVGVLLVLKPSGDIFGSEASSLVPGLIALGGTVAYALLVILTRQCIRHGAGNLVLITWHTLGVGLFGLLTLPWGWAAIDATTLALLGLIGVVATLAHICINHALKLAPAPLVVPYQYTSLLWAMLLGWIFFADIPSTSMLIGAAIIVASGLFVLHRQNKKQSEAA